MATECIADRPLILRALQNEKIEIIMADPVGSSLAHYHETLVATGKGELRPAGVCMPSRCHISVLTLRTTQEQYTMHLHHCIHTAWCINTFHWLLDPVNPHIRCPTFQLLLLVVHYQ